MNFTPRFCIVCKYSIGHPKNVYYTKKDLIQHLIDVHTEQAYQCTNCKEWNEIEYDLLDKLCIKCFNKKYNVHPKRKLKKTLHSGGSNHD